MQSLPITSLFIVQATKFKVGTMIYIQFKDESQKEVIAVFSSPQSEEYYPNQGEIADNDERYLSFTARYDNSAL